MKGKATAALLAILLFCTATSVSAYDIDWDVTTIGNLNIYTYMFTSGGEVSNMTGFYVYSPAATSVFSDLSNTNGWSHTINVDDVTGGSELYWYAEDINNGLGEGDSIQVSYVTSADIPILNDWVPEEGYAGNWGYEWDMLPGMAWVMYPSVPVPDAVSSVPEPCTMLALASGLGALGFFRRRK